MMQAQRTQTCEINAVQSLNLIKNLLRSGLSCIAYTRGMFPAECFKKQKISGIIVHTLQPTEPEPRKLIDWIDQGCLPSVEKRYLEELIFAIYAKIDVAGQDRFYLVETYNFQIRYHENDVVMTRKSQGVEVTRTIPTKQEISQATVSMIRALISMGGTMPPLPDDRAFSIKLLYRDDVTPQDYEPMHFRPVESEHQLRFFSKPDVVAIGNIATPYHELNLHVLVPEDCEKELATNFSSKEDPYTETYPAYSATINNAASQTLSDHIIPCNTAEENDISMAITGITTLKSIGRSEAGGDPKLSRCQHDVLPCDNTETRGPIAIRHSNKDLQLETVIRTLIEEERTITQAAGGSEHGVIQNLRKLSITEVSELLISMRNGVYCKISNDVFEVSPLAAEKLNQLVEMHSCESVDEMQRLYLELEIILFLTGGVPAKATSTHFRGTKMTRPLIREHLNTLVESGLAIRNNKGQVMANDGALPLSQRKKPPVDDEAETIETDDIRIRSQTKQNKQSAQQIAVDYLTSKLQKHLDSGVVAFTQSDIGMSQISRTDARKTTKRKISTSEDICQTSNKRTHS